ncbi:hypothetical protein IMSHALPRED_002819 [Imshaugia aleurites]|uniref:Uncharacterized protein n=1 Tax=Imshaugia aleurites TaxID=172621 RepID=A0A8H3J6E8_9LECA|nr:hypothetical protein IMSHALPRED_002819 [Imshaugia aleurites]
MLILRKTMALVAILISLCAPTPVIHVRNHSKQDICYKVEYSNGTDTFPSTAVCAQAKGAKVGGFWLRSGQTKVVNATGLDGQRFNGAITAVLKNNTRQGARNEINFLNATHTFYDISYQYGISDATCGPANGGEISGERHSLSKANAAWKHLNQTTKQDLLAFPQYLNQSANGSLTDINMSVDAWPTKAPEVVYFFQVTAGFKGYMGPGSVENVTYPPNSIQNISIPDADKQTLKTSSREMVITSY